MQFLQAAVTELKVSTGSTDREGINERIASRLERIEASYGRRILRGTGVLATIGATAPFIGLFGTVWGTLEISAAPISVRRSAGSATITPECDKNRGDDTLEPAGLSQSRSGDCTA